MTERKKAVLVAVWKGGAPQRELCDEHLDELSLLADTFGVDTAGKVPCQVRRFDASLFLGTGKLEEIKQTVLETGADLVIFDDEITPAQQRNLEKFFERPVMDRTEVILGVFAQRAQTREAKLQIKLAQVKYQAPRLKRMWTHLERQAGTAGGGMGGGAYLKGVGEKQIEIDRRLLKDEVQKLNDELEEVKAHRRTQRLARKRSGMPVFAIIGYTNAGKSTLLNAMTDAGIFVEDKLFATLDTTTRQFTLENNQKILLIDTVGFIRKLPHLLVAAFKSTLEEAVQADILIHLVDASHPLAEEQAATTFEVLKELGAKEKPVIMVLNKADKIEDQSKITRMRILYPKTVVISALQKTGLDDLQRAMIEELKKQRKVVQLRIPQSDYAAVSEVERLGLVFDREYEENDVLLKAELSTELATRLKPYIE
jgi:GTPase